MKLTPTVHQLRLPDGLRLEFAEQGSLGGPTLLMLHGITDSWRSFEPVLPFVDRGWHVIALSQRGHGGSGKPAQGYRTRDFAADAAAFVQAMELPPVVVVGHSMGAANAMRLAIDHPQCVRALVGVGAFASFGDKTELRDFVRSDIEPLADPVPRALADAFQRSTLARPVPELLLHAMVEQSLMAPARVWRDAFAGLLEGDFCDELDRITAPTLLLRGALDAFVPAADQDTLSRALPHARSVTWAGAGHAPHWEEPARFAAVLADFVETLAWREAHALQEQPRPAAGS
jgi:non-heme chloroperoxidase